MNNSRYTLINPGTRVPFCAHDRDSYTVKPCSHRQLGGGNLSFASEDRLEKYLGLKQGSVSPFGLMNDTDHQVEFFIDKDLSRCKSLGIHPLENTATVFLSYKDLDKFLWDLDVDVIKIKI